MMKITGALHSANALRNAPQFYLPDNTVNFKNLTITEGLFYRGTEHEHGSFIGQKAFIRRDIPDSWADLDSDKKSNLCVNQQVNFLPTVYLCAPYDS
jgi:hypothetical protein